MADVAAPAPAPAPASTPDAKPAASAPAPGPAASAPEKRKYSLKVDGQARDVEWDDTEVTTRLQKSEAADKRMAEAAAERKRLLEAFEYVKKDPFKALSDPFFGVDLEKLAEQRLAEKYQLELMKPEERAALEHKQALEKAQKEAAEARAELQRRADAELEQKTFAEIEGKFLGALKEEGMEATPEALFEMAQLADVALNNGIEYSEKQLARLVQEKVNGQRDRLLAKVQGGLKGQKLLEHLGEDVSREVARALVERLRSGQAPEPEPVVEAEAKPAAKGKREPAESLKSKRTYRDFWREMKRS